MSKRLLIVDDEETVREGIKELVDWAFYDFTDVETAQDGFKALESIEQHEPDIILLDINMPRMTGLQVMETIQARNIQCKVIIVSGLEDFKVAQQAIRLGATDYLLKPASPDEIVDAVLRSLQMIREEAEISETIQESEVNENILSVLSNTKRLREMFRGEDGICYPLKEEANLLVSIQCGDYEEVEHEYHVFFEKIREYNTEDSKKIKCILLITAQLLRVCIQSNLEVDDALFGNVSWENIEEDEQLNEALWRIILKIFESFNAKSNSHESVDKAVKFIHANYDQDMTLEILADEVHMTPTYLSQIFKRYIGKTYLNYLHSVRIEHAKDLLARGEFKIYEVSSKVGYKDEKYFAKLFKKYTGVSPSKY